MKSLIPVDEDDLKHQNYLLATLSYDTLQDELASITAVFALPHYHLLGYTVDEYFEILQK